MTPETEQAPAGYFRGPRMSPGEMQSPGRGAGAPVRSGELAHSAERAREAARARQRDAAAWLPPTRPQPTVTAPAPAPAPVPAPAPAVPAAAARPAVRPAPEEHARADGSIITVVPYLAVLIATIAGVYVAWHQGSAGAGAGGVVGGVALLAAAVLRLALPARLAGLLGTRGRVLDVLTLTVFGGGLLVVSLILPH